MTTPPIVTIEMTLPSAILDPDGFPLLDPDGFAIDSAGGWGDISRDILTTVPLVYSMGNMGHTIEDRVADVGTLTLAFNNSESNSQQLPGLYSPDSGSCLFGFTQDAEIRITITYLDVPYYQWHGYIVTIAPSAGSRGSRLTMVTAVDIMHYFQEEKFTGIPIQAGKRDDELLPLLIDALPITPEGTDFDTGDDTYTYAFHDEQSGSSSLLRVVQKMMMSGLGKFFVVGGTSNAQTLKYISRTGTLLTTTPVATLDNSMVALSVVRDETSRIKKVTVVSYPAQLDANNVVIWQLNKSIVLSGGKSATFTMRLRDPSGRATRSASYSTVPPAATTDYKFSSTDGSGIDKNADLTISYAVGADTVDVTVTNTSGVTGYLWFFQPRGKLVYLYEPVSVFGYTGQDRGQNLEINMWYQDDVFVAQDIVTVVSSWYAVPISNISSVSFYASANDTLMLAALEVQPGDLVLIKEIQTGVNATFFVNGKKTEITAGGRIIKVTWALTPANQLLDVFILDLGALDVDALGA